MSPAEARAQLVNHLRERGVADERVLAAIGRVDRARFLPPDLTERAYEDTSLPIGGDQTISQPTVVAMMTQALRLSGAERVLEIGTGSGYQAAVLGELVGSVISVERVPELRERAARLLRQLGYANVAVQPAGETLGWPAGAPYDCVIVTAGGPDIPPELLAQLAIGGRLVMPVGSLAEQRLIVATRTIGGADIADLGRVRFVPLIGSGGWPESASALEPPPDLPEPGEM
jgi:protein-L-isoaspartate(D-aspartate) O-methyltransferase